MWKFWQSIVFLKDEELDQLEESVEVLIHGYNKFFENGKLKRKKFVTLCICDVCIYARSI